MDTITIKDIAQKCGISYATVSRAINNRTGVNPVTRKKILDICQAMGYRPNAAARSLVTKQTKVLALTLPEIANPFYAEFALVVEEEAHKRGYNIIICNTNRDTNLEKEKLLLMKDNRVDGILLRPIRVDLAFYKTISLPMVLYDFCVEKDFFSVEIENEEGGYIATSFLISRGYKRIAFIGCRDDSANMKRFEGYRRSLIENSLNCDESITRFCDYTLESGFNYAGQFLKQENPPDAFFCTNDLLGLGVWHKAFEMGINVPNQLGIVGFDNIGLSSFPMTQLTTIEQPRLQIGKHCIDLLINQIETKQDYIHKIVLKPKLIIRNSTK